MNRFRWHAVLVFSVLLLCGAQPISAQTVPSGAGFGDRLRTALDTPSATGSVQNTDPTLGTSESDTSAPPTSTAGQPYNAGWDVASGITAAGGAFLGVILIVLLFGVIGFSKHHEIRE